MAGDEAVDRWLADLRASWVLSPSADHGNLSG
jgi:hypothetical protein